MNKKAQQWVDGLVWSGNDKDPVNLVTHQAKQLAYNSFIAGQNSKYEEGKEPHEYGEGYSEGEVYILLNKCLMTFMGNKDFHLFYWFEENKKQEPANRFKI